MCCVRCKFVMCEIKLTLWEFKTDDFKAEKWWLKVHNRWCFFCHVCPLLLSVCVWGNNILFFVVYSGSVVVSTINCLSSGHGLAFIDEKFGSVSIKLVTCGVNFGSVKWKMMALEFKCEVPFECMTCKIDEMKR